MSDNDKAKKLNIDNKLSSSKKPKTNHNYFKLIIFSSIFILSLAYLIIVFNSSSSTSTLLKSSLFSTTSFLFSPKETSKQDMAAESVEWKNAKTIYEFSALDIEGNNIDLSKYK